MHKHLADYLSQTVQEIYWKGWCPGTGGNFSVVCNNKPLQLLITQSGKNKQKIVAEDLVIVDKQGEAIENQNGQPSAETLLHCEIISHTKCKSVLHTHSIWNTLLGNYYCKQGGFEIANYEMLKGLKGIKTHQTTEFIPILENSQNMKMLGKKVNKLLKEKSSIHCFLLAGHGLYTWGDSIDEAYRHLEVLEFLFECVGRSTNFTIER